LHGKSTAQNAQKVSFVKRISPCPTLVEAPQTLVTLSAH